MDGGIVLGGVALKLGRSVYLVVSVVMAPGVTALLKCHWAAI